MLFGFKTGNYELRSSTNNSNFKNPWTSWQSKIRDQISIRIKPPASSYIASKTFQVPSFLEFIFLAVKALLVELGTLKKNFKSELSKNE
jgi:hypothetical protein